MNSKSPQDVNSTPVAPTSDEIALAAISDILDRTDIKATAKCHRMLAVFRMEEQAVSKERAAQKLAWLVWKKTDGLCTYCNEVLNPFERTAWNGFQIDHIIPRAHGGTDDPGNLTPACGRCNWSKYARTPEQWGGAQ